MPSYKLTYFNLRGRAELARLVFAAAGVEYEDKRINGEEWAKLKPTTPWGTLPVLEVDGVAIGQSIVIARFAAREFGLHGKTSVEAALADSIVDAVNDLTNAFAKAKFAKGSEEEKAEAFKQFAETTLPQAWTNLEKHLKANKDGQGFFVGNELTWADLAVMYVFDSFGKVNEDALSKYQLLQDHRARVTKIPRIAKWLADRPVTDM